MLSSCDEYLGCLFFRSADEERFKELKKALDNLCLFGKDDYPTSIEDTLRMMQHHKPTQTVKNNHHGRQIQSDGVTLAQLDHGGRQGWSRDTSTDKSFNCGAIGHHAKDCPGEDGVPNKKEGTDFFNLEDEVNQLDVDMEGIILEEGTDLLTLSRVGLLEVGGLK